MQYLTVVATMSYRYRTEFNDDDDQQGRFLAILKRILGIQPKVSTCPHEVIDLPFDVEGMDRSHIIERYYYSDLMVDTTDDVVLKLCDECYKQHVDISISNTSCVHHGLVEQAIEVRLLNSRYPDMMGDDAMPRVNSTMKSSHSRLNSMEGGEDDE